MCQCQLSSSTLPSDAATPPCAATVCERVGNTLDSTATRRSARASSSAARMPEPPPPTMTASNARTGSAILETPQDADRPQGVPGERADHEDIEREPQARVLDVIHEDIAHPDPGVDQEAQHEEDGGVLDERRLPQHFPLPVIHLRQPRDRRDDDAGIDQHDHRGDALGDPVAQAVVRADDLALHHISIPNTAVRTIAATMTAQLVARAGARRSEEHTSELQSRLHLVCRLLLEKKKKKNKNNK